MGWPPANPGSSKLPNKMNYRDLTDEDIYKLASEQWEALPQKDRTSVRSIELCEDLFCLREMHRHSERIVNMGCYDIVNVPCPQCGEKQQFQSKSGPCYLGVFELDDCPADIMMDVNRHAPATCSKCGTRYYVEFERYAPDKRTVSVRNVRAVLENTRNNPQ